MIPVAAVAEDLEESARIAPGLAARHCRGCDWYHGFWPELRRLRLAGTLAPLSDFFAAALARISTERPRLLVSGAADQAILAQVLDGSRRAGIDPRVSVLDRCETPLALNRVHAQRIARPVETLRADLFEHLPDAAYDAICCHGFLGEFAPQRRGPLFAQFRRLLAPGGILIAINRLRDADPTRPIRCGDAESRALLATVEKRSADRPAIERARIFFRRMQAWPLARPAIESLFAGAALALELSTAIDSHSPENEGLDGVAIASRARHGCFVGRKPLLE